MHSKSPLLCLAVAAFALLLAGCPDEKKPTDPSTSTSSAAPAASSAAPNPKAANTGSGW